MALDSPVDTAIWMLVHCVRAQKIENRSRINTPGLTVIGKSWLFEAQLLFIVTQLSLRCKKWLFCAAHSSWINIRFTFSDMHTLVRVFCWLLRRCVEYWNWTFSSSRRYPETFHWFLINTQKKMSFRKNRSYRKFWKLRITNLCLEFYLDKKILAFELIEIFW